MSDAPLEDTTPSRAASTGALLATRRSAMTIAEEAPDHQRPQLLFFYDPTDGRARRIEGFLAQVLQRRRNHDTVAVRRIDVRAHANLVERFGVQSTPALVVVHDKRVGGRLERPSGCQAIRNLLQPWLR
jgi:thioredoxin-like negative regulator of GroEL